MTKKQKKKKFNPIKKITGKIGNIPVTVTFNSYGIVIKPEGYGEYTSKNGQGEPILITNPIIGEGLEVIIWADINKEDATHIISLEGAKESERNKT